MAMRVQEENVLILGEFGSYLDEVKALGARMRAEGVLSVVNALSRVSGAAVQNQLRMVWDMNKWPLDSGCCQTDKTYQGLAADMLAVRAHVLGDYAQAKAFQMVRQMISQDSPDNGRREGAGFSVKQASNDSVFCSN